MRHIKPALAILAVSVAALAETACSDRNFNPYLDGNQFRNIGQTAEAVSGAFGDAANWIDFRVEKTLY